MNKKPTYLSEAHRKSSEKALALAAKQSPMSSEEFTKQAHDLASASRRNEPSDSNSSERYEPSRSENSAA